MIVDCGPWPALIETRCSAPPGLHRGGQGPGQEVRGCRGGTLVLDEINSLPLSLQSKPLRAVEDRAFEPLGSNQTQTLWARIIAISNVPLREEVARNRFRADLYYRLNVVGFRLLRLGEQRVDILPLTRKFLAEHPVARARGVIDISPQAMDAMEAYAWPGNIRELRNAIERTAVLCTSRVVSPADLPEPVREPAPAPAPAAVAAARPSCTGGPRALRSAEQPGPVRAELGWVTLYKKLRNWTGQLRETGRCPRFPGDRNQAGSSQAFDTPIAVGSGWGRQRTCGLTSRGALLHARD